MFSRNEILAVIHACEERGESDIGFALEMSRMAGLVDAIKMVLHDTPEDIGLNGLLDDLPLLNRYQMARTLDELRLQLKKIPSFNDTTDLLNDLERAAARYQLFFQQDYPQSTEDAL
jgi:hypothetical protein